jgi:hypothetical protein
MFGFLSKLAGLGAKIFSKVKPAVQGAVRLYDKGKALYSTVKNTISSVPVVGALAENYIRQGEQKVADFAKEKLGLTASGVDRAVSMADRMTRDAS